MNLAVFYPDLVARGGSQRYAIETVRAFKNNGHNVQLYTFTFNKEICYPELTQNIEIIYLYSTNKMLTAFGEAKNRFSKFYAFLKLLGPAALLQHWKNEYLAKKLVLVIKYYEFRHSFRYDALYIHETGDNSLARLLNVPKKYLYCYDTPDKMREWEDYNLKTKFFYRAFSQLTRKYFRKNDYVSMFDKIFVLDEVMKQRVSEFYGVMPHKIYGGINTSIFQPTKNYYIQERFSLPRDSVILSCVSRFMPYRRIHDAIEAVIRIGLQNVFLYINAPPEDRYYYDLINTTYITHLFPRGNIIIQTEPFVNDKELAAIYQSSNIFIFPNENQTWGNAVLEAMSCGCCSVVSDGCGIKEIIRSGENGFIYPCGNINELKNILSSLIDDLPKARFVGIKAAEYIKNNFSWEKWYDNHIQEFEIAH